MSIAPDQLTEISKQLREFFVSHPHIMVTPAKGDPPDQYTITYTVTGLSKNRDGEVIEVDSHTIELAIPFGFPHFPPSCKPKSEIYHPDFDPGAICLGDFWEDNSDLPSLIVHIGKLINGEFYSRSNAFDEDAAVWYEDNSDKFPLATVNWSAGVDRQTSEENDQTLVDTLDDDDLSENFDYLNMENEGEEDEITLSDTFPEIDPSSGQEFDFEVINLLNQQKNYCKLTDLIKGQAHSSDELAELAEVAKEEVAKAEDLYRQAKLLEKEGDAANALLKYEQVATTVSDFPSIGADINRVNQTLTLLDNVTPSASPSRPVEEPQTTPQPEKKQPQPASTKKEKRKKKKDPFSEEREPRSKIPLLLLLILIVAITGGSYFYYNLSKEKLQESTAGYKKCVQQLQAEQFTAAQSSCQGAKESVSSIKFLHNSEVKKLITEIDKTLQSEKLTMGIAGKILFDGRYIYKKDAARLEKLHSDIAAADALFSDNEWLPAVTAYKTLLSDNEDKNNIPQERAAEIEEKINFARFQLSLNTANKAITKKKWQDAELQIASAQKLLEKLPEEDQAKFGAILENKLDLCQFEMHKAEGQFSFSQGRWLEAIESFENSLRAIENNIEISANSQKEIHSFIAKADLYRTIDEGNKAFGSGRWNKAIDSYLKADTLMKSQSQLLADSKSAISQTKLTRIILQASIIRDQQAVKAQLEDEELHEARRTYLQILDSINSSIFKTDSEFVSTKSEIQSALVNLDEKIYLEGKKLYLEDNFQKLFTQNYPAAVEENLINPVIAFVNENSYRMVFRMQCTENRRGRPLTLVMFYAYDKQTNSWTLYTDQN